MDLIGYSRYRILGKEGIAIELFEVGCDVKTKLLEGKRKKKLV